MTRSGLAALLAGLALARAAWSAEPVKPVAPADLIGLDVISPAPRTAPVIEVNAASELAPSAMALPAALATLPDLTASARPAAQPAPVEAKTTLSALAALGAAPSDPHKGTQELAAGQASQYDGVKAAPEALETAARAEIPESHTLGYARYAPALESDARRDESNRATLDRYIDRLYPPKAAANLKAAARGIDAGTLDFLHFAAFVNGMAPGARDELIDDYVKDELRALRTSYRQPPHEARREIEKALAKADRRLASLPESALAGGTEAVMKAVLHETGDPQAIAAISESLRVFTDFRRRRPDLYGPTARERFLLADEDVGIRLFNAAARADMFVFGLMDGPRMVDGRTQDQILFFHHDIGHALLIGQYPGLTSGLAPYEAAVAGLAPRERAMFDLVDFLALHELESFGTLPTKGMLTVQTLLELGRDNRAETLAARLDKELRDYRSLILNLRDEANLGALLPAAQRRRAGEPHEAYDKRLGKYLHEALAVWALAGARPELEDRRADETPAPVLERGPARAETAPKAPPPPRGGSRDPQRGSAAPEAMLFLAAIFALSRLVPFQFAVMTAFALTAAYAVGAHVLRGRRASPRPAAPPRTAARRESAARRDLVVAAIVAAFVALVDAHLLIMLPSLDGSARGQTGLAILVSGLGAHALVTQVLRRLKRAEHEADAERLRHQALEETNRRRFVESFPLAARPAAAPARPPAPAAPAPAAPPPAPAAPPPAPAAERHELLDLYEVPEAPRRPPTPLRPTPRQGPKPAEPDEPAPAWHNQLDLYEVPETPVRPAASAAPSPKPAPKPAEPDEPEPAWYNQLELD